MTKKERDQLELLKDLAEISGNQHRSLLSNTQVEYFGYLILKDELFETNQKIKKFEETEEYEKAAKALKIIKELEKHISEIKANNNFKNI